MDTVSAEVRSRNMRAIKSRETLPEMTVRRLLHGVGYRYRLHEQRLPGRPDLVFVSRRKVIFVHGCFWHQHGAPNCADGRRPKSRVEYWDKKLNANVSRDLRNLAALDADGWKVLVIWECETKDLTSLKHKLIAFLSPAS